MGLQHPGRPFIEAVLPGLVRRTVPVHPPQVMRVPHRPLISRHPIQPAMNHQLPQRIPTLGVHLDPGDIGHLARRTPCPNLVPQTLHPGHLAIVDQGCQTADAAVRPEAMAVTQHADALVQQRAIFCPVSLQPAVDGLLRHPGHPVGRLRPVASLAGMGTQLTQNGACLHRRQLVLVPQQDEPCPGWQCMHHLRHHFQVDHRGLVDHQHVQRQRIARVMPEMPRARPAAQQPVQCRDGPRNGRPDRLALGHVLQRQPVNGAADRAAQSCRGLAGGRRQPDAQELPLPGQRQPLQQGQQPDHRRRLACARPPGDQPEAPSCRQRTGNPLPVRPAPGLCRRIPDRSCSLRPGRVRRTGCVYRMLCPGTARSAKQHHQRLLQARLFFAGQTRQHQPLPDALLDVLLVLPETPQVQPMLHQHQRRRPGPLRGCLIAPPHCRGLRHQRWTGHAGCLPVRQRQRLQPRAHRNRQHRHRLLQHRLQIQTDMAPSQLPAAQRRRQQHRRQCRRRFRPLRQKVCQFQINAPQPAILMPACQKRQHAGHVRGQHHLRLPPCLRQRSKQVPRQLVLHRFSASPCHCTFRHGLSAPSVRCPEKAASSASITARGGRAANTPRDGAPLPRRNR